MTRKDIIVVAVLANIGILAVLFMLAVRLEDAKVHDSSEIAFVISPTPSTEVSTIEIDVNKDDEDVDDSDTFIDEAIPMVSAVDQEPEEETFQFAEVEPVKPVVTAPANTVDVTVKKGDVLEKIARANGTTVDAILKANNLKSDKLKVGQVLHVPVNTRKPAAKPLAVADAPTTTASQPQYYTVKSGDNPWKIAKQFHLKVDELLKLNNLNEESARNMKIGDQIRVK